MPTVFVKDERRAAVEAASGGRQTVLYTQSGQPSIVNIIPAFNLQDIDASLGTGVHPAFVVNGVTKSEIFIGTYQGIIKNGELLSLPGVDPTTSRNHDQFVAAARAAGPGWHCITNIEFAALGAWCWKSGFMPRGNTAYGRSSDASFETGLLVNGGLHGETSILGRTLTGSGPNGWRHDNSPNGISDLSGNIWEWSPGVRLVGGELQVIEGNNAAMLAIDIGPTSAAWRAINGATGELVAPTHTGSIATDDYVPTTANSVRLAASGTANYTLVRASGQSFEGLTNAGATPVAAAGLQALKKYGLFPLAGSGLGGDGIWFVETGERLPVRGGDWSSGANAGVFALNLGDPRAHASGNIGSRPAFVI